MKKIKIGYFADGPWSHRAFQRLISDDSIQINFIIPRNDSNDSTLKNFAESYNIDYLCPVDIGSKKTVSLLEKYDCDLFVSMSYNQIFKPHIFNIPKFNTINCHAGKLPFYRGRNVLNWVLVNDEKDFGITVHYIDEGIDTGDIILQRYFRINDEDDYGSLLEIAYEECANILYDSIKLIQSNNVLLIKQKDIHPIGFYCGKRTDGDEYINWHDTSRNVFNFIRSISEPGPIARSRINGGVITINKSNYIEEAPSYIGIPGQIIGKDSTGYFVKCLDTFIKITQTSCSLKIGDRFESKK